MKKRIEQYIESYKNTTIALEELESIFVDMKVDPDVFTHAVLALEQDGILQAVKSAGRTMRRPSLAYRYRIHKQRLAAGYHQRLQQYRLAIHSAIQLDSYYARPESEFEQDKPWIDLIDRYLRQEGWPQSDVPAPERSYQLTGNEKWITDLGGHTLLRRLGLWDQLRIHPVSDPLMFAVNPVNLRESVHSWGSSRWGHDESEGQSRGSSFGQSADLSESSGISQSEDQIEGHRVGQSRCHRDRLGVLRDELATHLIVENKTTFQALLPILSESNCHTLIYGCGNKITGNIEMFPLQYPLADVRHQFYYFGDIDYEGIRIWYDTHQQRPMLPAIPFYEACLSYPAASGKTYQRKDEEALAAFLTFFPPGQQEMIRNNLENGGYYPQEILSTGQLQHIWRSSQWTQWIATNSQR